VAKAQEEGPIEGFRGVPPSDLRVPPHRRVARGAPVGNPSPLKGVLRRPQVPSGVLRHAVIGAVVRPLYGGEEQLKYPSRDYPKVVFCLGMGVDYVWSFYGTLCVPKGDLVQLPPPMPA